MIGHHHLGTWVGSAAGAGFVRIECTWSIESPTTAGGMTRMSNLGGYQRITTVIKSLGGPTKATVIVGSVVATGGFGVLRAPKPA